MTATLIQTSQQPTILLKNISWETYQSLLKDLAEQPGMRLTYNQGLLEIMTPLDSHEGYKKIIGRFVDVITEELNINVRSLGSRTCDRQDLARGFEPDECYYIENEATVWDLEQIDLNQYPPPDLILEIDITSSSINKFELYAAFGVPEVWRYERDRIIFYQLKGKQYIEIERSRAFPMLTSTDILRFLELRKTTKETPLIKLFREWVRSQVQEKL